MLKLTRGSDLEVVKRAGIDSAGFDSVAREQHTRERLAERMSGDRTALVVIGWLAAASLVSDLEIDPRWQ